MRADARMLAALMTCVGCYGHGVRPAAKTARAVRSGLPAARSGTYRITRDGAEVGTETFTVTSSASRWIVEGEAQLHEPLESRHGYRLEVDAERLEPVAFEMWLSLEGERRRLVGRRAGPYFEVRQEGGAGPRARRVPYALGTAVDFDSPVFASFVLGLLGPRLREGRDEGVRTVRVTAAELWPTVGLLTYERRPPDPVTGQARVVVRVPRSGEVRALWVAPDGFVERARWFAPDGTPSREWRLVLEG